MKSMTNPVSKTGCLWRYLGMLVFFGLVTGLLILLGEEAITRWKALCLIIPYPCNWIAGGAISLLMLAADFAMPLLKVHIEKVNLNFWLYYIFYEFYLFSFLIIIFGGLAYFFTLITVYDGWDYYLLLVCALGIFAASCLLAMRDGLRKGGKSSKRSKKECQ